MWAMTKSRSSAPAALSTSGAGSAVPATSARSPRTSGRYDEDRVIDRDHLRRVGTRRVSRPRDVSVDEAGRAAHLRPLFRTGAGFARVGRQSGPLQRIPGGRPDLVVVCRLWGSALFSD